MQVKCICNKSYENVLTVGKVYDVIGQSEDYIKITDDRGVVISYRKERFENVPAEPSGKVMTCIDGIGLVGFTTDKNYNVNQSDVYDECYRAFNDLGILCHVNKKHFTEPSFRSKQIGGTHYSDLTIQPFEFIDKNNLTFFEGNVVKYLSRYNSKDGNKDIDKAIHYVRESFERLEHFQSRTIGMTAKAYCSANNLPPVVELVLCWILEYPISIEIELIVNLLEGLKK